MEERLTELEIRFEEQQRTIQELSDVVYQQQRAIDALRAELERLRQRLQAEPGIVDVNEREKPPHY